ncbi:hypothetical protein GGR07_001412 [Bacteroides pyogenes]|nr:hypothetical protein [Bacteroides pyogenes]SUV32109.1 Uncharacterised protein [Bacteroides pyogenes]
MSILLVVCPNVYNMYFKKKFRFVCKIAFTPTFSPLFSRRMRCGQAIRPAGEKAVRIICVSPAARHPERLSHSRCAFVL